MFRKSAYTPVLHIIWYIGECFFIYPQIPSFPACGNFGKEVFFHMTNSRKAAVIGCGNVGASIAFTFMQKALFSSLALIDANRMKAEGEAMDLSHGLPYASQMDIFPGTYDDLSDCAFAVIAAGVNQRPGETRLELLGRNLVILRSILSELSRTDFSGILLIVTNPVDILTYAARCFAPCAPYRVIGSGTVLDTARLKFLLSRRLSVDSRNVHAFIIGEHGDSELPVFSGANVSGVDIAEFMRLSGHSARELDEIFEDVRSSAYDVIERKGATYYAIAMAAARIAECIVRDEKTVLPVSVELEGQYGLSGLALSIPSVLGKDGVERILEIPLSQEEQRKLLLSADAIKRVIENCGIGKSLYV